MTQETMMHMDSNGEFVEIMQGNLKDYQWYRIEKSESRNNDSFQLRSKLDFQSISHRMSSMTFEL